MDTEKSGFEEAGKGRDQSLVWQAWHMIQDNKKYWLIPLIAGLLCFGLLAIWGGSSLAPFIYSLF